MSIPLGYKNHLKTVRKNQVFPIRYLEVTTNTTLPYHLPYAGRLGAIIYLPSITSSNYTNHIVGSVKVLSAMSNTDSRKVHMVTAKFHM